MPADRVRYAERRRVPWWWWAVTLAVAVPSVEVVAVFAPEGAAHRGWHSAAIAFLATVVVVAAALLTLSRSRIQVDEHGLWADGALLPTPDIGRIRVLGAEEARLVLGRDAQVGARLSIKPWLHRAIQVEVADPADATPYWVVATRRPEALAAALRELRGTAADPVGPPSLDRAASGDEGDHQSWSAPHTGAQYRAGVEKGQQ
jgi:hypothetical protein